ncbi:hypothetical protein DXG01_010266, partial [Tephrocybe rancida]
VTSVETADRSVDEEVNEGIIRWNTGESEPGAERNSDIESATSTATLTTAREAQERKTSFGKKAAMRETVMKTMAARSMTMRVLTALEMCLEEGAVKAEVFSTSHMQQTVELVHK